MSKIQLPKNCEIELIEEGSRDFRLRFTSDDHQDYVSEIYTPAKGQRTRRAAYEVCEKFGWLKEPPNGPEKVITSLQEFLTWRGFGNDEPRYWARCFYKYTACGPWAVFLMADKPAHDIEHPDVTARIRCVRGHARLMNPKDLDDDFVQFLGFDKQGLDRKERTWENYVKLVDDFIADEGKMARTKYGIEIEKRTVAELHIRRHGWTEHVDAVTKEIYYEDIGPVYAYREVKCGCASEVIGTHPDDPQEEIYRDKDPDPDCDICHGRGTHQMYMATGEVIEVDPELCVGIKFGSIVEGSEVCSGPFEHMFPFKAKDFERDLKYMEKETSFYWERDNGSWYCVRTDDEEWYVVNVWGDIRWESEPPEPIKTLAEEAMKNDWQPDPERPNSCIVQTIPQMPDAWTTPKDSDKYWKGMPLGDTGAEVYTFENNSTFD